LNYDASGHSGIRGSFLVLPQRGPLVSGGLLAQNPDILRGQGQQAGRSTAALIKKTYAHPFAHTENYFPGEEERIAYDSQIIKPASMHTTSSSFLSKAFLLRYYEEEVELNDLCHFRVETDLSTA
jgi:hypothetical protein